MNGIMYLLLVIFLWTSVLGANCPYKECFCGGSMIFCDDRYLKAIPQLLLKKNYFMSSLSMDRNQITTIPAKSLPPNLTDISLQNNPIETIDPAAFDGSINTLTTLTFSQARFTQLPEAVLHLNVLNSLSLYDINIKAWDEQAMKRFGATVATLNLDTVGLTSWPDWMQYFSHLTELSVTSSSITCLPDNALDMVANTLTSLGLYNNSLTSVPKTLSKLTTLRTLSLEQNKITDITWLPRFGTLSVLSLNNNRISNSSALSDILSLHAETLFSFDIHDNLLSSIPDLSFLKNVPTLDFTHNILSNPNSGSVSQTLSDLKLSNNLFPFVPRILKTLPKLSNLVLSHNSITAIQASDFLNSTTGLDLGHNYLTELSDTSFPEGSAITYLLLNNNPLSKISNLAFKNVPNLQQLDLQNTKLARIPLAIATLVNLYQLDFTGSLNLVCTCMEKSLQVRIQAMTADNALGDCGQVSVYTFFTQLSPGCPGESKYLGKNF